MAIYSEAGKLVLLGGVPEIIDFQFILFYTLDLSKLQFLAGRGLK